MKRKVISALVLSTAIAMPLAALAAGTVDGPLSPPQSSGTTTRDEGPARAEGAVQNPETGAMSNPRANRDSSIERRNSTMGYQGSRRADDSAFPKDPAQRSSNAGQDD